MAFRGKLIEMIENHVEALKTTKYLITDTMQSNFVGFVNSFFKHHTNFNAVEFKLSSNILFAQMDNIRIIIAADETKGYCIPGSNNDVNMREPVEAFILIGDNMCSDSVLMRTFFQNTLPTEEKYETYVPVQTAPVKVAPAQNNLSTNFIFQGAAATDKPSAPPAAPTTNLFTSNAPTTPATSPPTTNLFAQNATSPPTTNLFAQPPTPAPSNMFAQNATTPPTNLFAQTPAPTPSTNLFSTNTTNKPTTNFFSQTPASTSFSTFPKPATTPSLTFGGSLSRQSSIG
jgi:hypothetical protein